MSKTVKAKGQDQEVKVEYGYSNDRLTRITHNGFNYGFGYDEFGKTRLVAIAGSSVVSYEYEEKNGKLLKTKYANGDYLRYEYDTQGRLVKEYYYSAAAQKEQTLRSYIYDREGHVYRTRDYASGKTYEMSYDFLDRLMRVRDEKGNVYQYTYDGLNRLTRENNELLGKTVTYYYDGGGDLREEREYDYTTGTVSGTPKKYMAAVMDEKWKDKLLKWGSTAMTYDACGNMRYQFRTAAKCRGRLEQIYLRRSAAAFWDGRDAHQSQTGAAKQRIARRAGL